MIETLSSSPGVEAVRTVRDSTWQPTAGPLTAGPPIAGPLDRVESEEEAIPANFTTPASPLEEWVDRMVMWLTKLPQNRTVDEDVAAVAPYETPEFQAYLESEGEELSSSEVWHLSMLLGMREAILRILMIGGRQDVYGMIFLVATLITLTSSFVLLAKYSKYFYTSLSIYHRRWRQKRADAKERQLDLKATKTVELLLGGENLPEDVETGHIEKGGIPPEQGKSAPPGTHPKGGQCPQCVSIYCTCLTLSQLPPKGGRAGETRSADAPRDAPLSQLHRTIERAATQQSARRQVLEPRERASAPLLYPSLPVDGREGALVEAPPPHFPAPVGETWSRIDPPRYRDDTVVGDIRIEVIDKSLEEREKGWQLVNDIRMTEDETLDELKLPALEWEDASGSRTMKDTVAVCRWIASIKQTKRMLGIADSTVLEIVRDKVPDSLKTRVLNVVTLPHLFSLALGEVPEKATTAMEIARRLSLGPPGGSDAQHTPQAVERYARETLDSVEELASVEPRADITTHLVTSIVESFPSAFSGSYMVKRALLQKWHEKFQANRSTMVSQLRIWLDEIKTTAAKQASREKSYGSQRSET